MGRTGQRQFRFPRLVFQMVGEDGFDADVGAGAEMQGAFAGGLQSFGAGGLAQPQEAQAGAETLFGMGATGGDVFHDPRTMRAGLLGPLHDPAGGPLQIALMRLGPMFLDRGEPSALMAAGVRGHALAALKQLDGVFGQTHVQRLMDQMMGHTVVVVIHHDVVVDVDRRHGPHGQLECLGWQGQQLTLLLHFKPLVPRAVEFWNGWALSLANSGVIGWFNAATLKNR